MKELTMEDLIKACEEKRQPNEIIVYAIGAGRIIPKLGYRKIMKQTIDYIKSLDGFIGIHPIDIWHTLLIFDTLNNAKAAHNLLKFKKVPIGQIAPILIPDNNINKEV